MVNKKIYVVLTQTYSYVARTIKLVTSKEYSHVSISFDREFNNMYSFGRKIHWLPLPGGFIVEDINKGLFAKHESALIKVYEVDVTDKQYKNIKKVIEDIMVNNKGYNLAGLFLAYFKIKLNRNKYYCSEFVYEVLSDSSVGILDSDVIRFQPEEIIDNECFHEVYEGKIKDYIRTL